MFPTGTPPVITVGLGGKWPDLDDKGEVGLFTIAPEGLVAETL